MRNLLLALLVFFNFSYASAETTEPAKCDVSKNVDPNSFIQIQDFFIKDFSRNLYIIQLKADDIDKLKKSLTLLDNTNNTQTQVVKKTDFYISINGINTTEIPNSFKYNNSYSLEYEIVPVNISKLGNELCLKIYTEESASKGFSLAKFSYKLPERLSGAGNQPLIQEIHPGAGVIGDTLTIRGINLGKDVDDIYIYVISESKKVIHKNSKEDKETAIPVYPWDDQDKCSISPFYLSQPFPIAEDSKELIQEIKFTIPNYIDDECMENAKFSFKEWILGKEIKIKLMTNARPTTVETITLLHKRWKVFYAFFSVVLILGFTGLLSTILKKINFFSDILLDPVTNSYALANFQSFVWTLVLLGSYFYVALCQWTILVNQTILPDFNAKLTVLLGISFGGSIISAFLQKSKDSETKRKDKPEWRDLITDPNGGIDVSKLQLLGFTIICVIIYLLFLSKCNPLKGLPDIPETLHGLLGISQASYLATKAVDKKAKPEEKKAE